MVRFRGSEGEVTGPNRPRAAKTEGRKPVGFVLSAFTGHFLSHPTLHLEAMEPLGGLARHP